MVETRSICRNIPSLPSQDLILELYATRKGSLLVVTNNKTTMTFNVDDVSITISVIPVGNIK